MIQEVSGVVQSHHHSGIVSVGKLEILVVSAAGLTKFLSVKIELTLNTTGGGVLLKSVTISCNSPMVEALKHYSGCNIISS